ncbi:hypothetical protein [Flavobacterium silvaticum]|uniref:Uncharacterized protein n=1 Tax=Flavobacterium silvaticum TaxID=1852020 RepID=A0A972FLV5_9FLAO|nr:hypothetical protein [Flavobacterium silvaticum]NMH28128.1 hypothetical protein [Flavobacterium silvaticum]
MKVFSFLLSALAFLTSAYFFIVDFRITTESNHLIYMGMLITLMSICILGIILNAPYVFKTKRRAKSFTYSSYMQQRIKNKSFDSQLGLM